MRLELRRNICGDQIRNTIVEIKLIVRLFYISHNSYFLSRYYYEKSNYFCLKIVENTQTSKIYTHIWYFITGLHVFLSISRAILAIALLYKRLLSLPPISAPIFNGGWRWRSMPQPTTNLTNRCRDSISFNVIWWHCLLNIEQLNEVETGLVERFDDSTD